MTVKSKPNVARGLEGIIAMETALSSIDGDRGELIIAGHMASALALERSFEEVFCLLFHGELPDAKTLKHTRARIGEARVRAHERLAGHAAARFDDPMDALRAMVAQLPASEDLEADAIDALGTIAVANALWWHSRQHTLAPAPDASLDHAMDTLRMLRAPDAPTPSRELASALGSYLVTVSDHGMNASTFTARVIASTQSDLIASVVGAIGALKGPLHGGAPGPVLDMLDAIGSPGAALEWVEGELAAKRRIMGMGHRVYRVRDPRAAIFEEVLARLEGGEDRSPRLALARAVEAVATSALAEKYPERDLRANVEFYTAILLEAVGIPRELFTATFAVGRAIGWSAHVREQRQTGRLLRPRALYIGARPGSSHR